MLRISFSFDTPNPDCGITYFLTKPLFSQELQNDLEQALVRIDISAMDRAIEAIRAHHPSLADALAAAAGGFQFDRMLRMIRAAHGEGSPKIETRTMK